MNYNSVYHGKLATALGAAASGGAGVVFNATLHGQPMRPSRQKHLEPTCHTFEWAWLMGLWALYKSDPSSLSSSSSSPSPQSETAKVEEEKRKQREKKLIWGSRELD